MKKLLKVAIVGRPNVGKSALFNRICKKKIAIVDEAEGITRDRLYAQSDFFGFPFEVIDTGGINARSKVAFNEQIRRQAEIAIEEADSLIMVVDAHAGITELDHELAHVLLRTQKPLCLAVNKVDDQRQEHVIYSFKSLGISKCVAVSATQSWHIAELLEQALSKFDKTLPIEDDTASKAINICIVGRPNVGKSSLVNYLLNEERCIVSPIPGTTRDSIDIPFTHNGTLFNLIDTAGIRRKKSEHEVVDKFAFIRTQRAIDRADICLLMMDAQQGITVQEKKIANMIEESGKGCILLFNKWDLVKGFRMEHCLKGIQEEASFLNHCPTLFMSAISGRNIEKIFGLIQQVHMDSQKRISTHELNKFIGACLQKNHPPMITGKRLRIYYMAQVQIQPPLFIVFVNHPHLMIESYKKYLYNQFRETYAFSGVPITMHLRGKPKLTREERQDKSSYGKAQSPSISEDEEPNDFDEEDDHDDNDENLLDESFFRE